MSDEIEPLSHRSRTLSDRLKGLKGLARRTTSSSTSSAPADDSGNISDIQITHHVDRKIDYKNALLALRHADPKQRNAKQELEEELNVARDGYGIEIASELTRAEHELNQCRNDYVRHETEDPHSQRTKAAQRAMEEVEARVKNCKNRLFVLYYYDEAKDGFEKLQEYRAVEHRYNELLPHLAEGDEAIHSQMAHVERELLKCEAEVLPGLRRLEPVTDKYGTPDIKAYVRAQVAVANKRIPKLSENIKVRAVISRNPRTAPRPPPPSRNLPPTPVPKRDGNWL